NDEGDATRNAWSTSDVDDSFHFLMERRFSNSKPLSEDFLMGHWHQAGRGSLGGSVSPALLFTLSAIGVDLVLRTVTLAYWWNGNGK
ncbi:hypothetical protein BaRGS_00028195, partial [Batillaria attramentaria]